VTEHEDLQRYMKTINAIPLLTEQEESALAQRVKCGDLGARERMITANLRLCVSIANSFVGRGVDLMDLISEANSGLTKAVDVFDPERGVRLSSAAGYWIRQKILRTIADHSKTIRIPIFEGAKIAKVRAVSARMAEELGRQPTDDEIADEIGLTVKKVAFFRQTDQATLSLDAMIDTDQGSREFGETVEDVEATSPVSALMDANLKATMLACMDCLNERGRFILVQRFGLSGGKPQTLGEIGAKLEITRERVRQCQNQSLAKLKRAMAEAESGRITLHFNGNGKVNGNGRGH
jgi:RNA polymerase primary sigma factor